MIVESGSVETTNVPIRGRGRKADHRSGRSHDPRRRGHAARPARRKATGTAGRCASVLAPEVVLAAKQGDRSSSGDDGVPVVLKPGVKVHASDVQQPFIPAQFNPDHAKYIARCEKAKPMAVNMYSGFWTLLVCVAGDRSA